MKEELGKMIIDGQLIDLDTAPIEKLKKIKERLDEKERIIRAEIDKLLNDEE